MMTKKKKERMTRMMMNVSSLLYPKDDPGPHTM